jgi:hypothetical protein
MRYIGVFFEVGSTRAGALPARPCHFQVERRTGDARAGRSILSGFSASSCARCDVCALWGVQPFFCSFLQWGSRFSWVARGGGKSLLWVAGEKAAQTSYQADRVSPVSMLCDKPTRSDARGAAQPQTRRPYRPYRVMGGHKTRRGRA